MAMLKSPEDVMHSEILLVAMLDHLGLALRPQGQGHFTSPHGHQLDQSRIQSGFTIHIQVGPLLCAAQWDGAARLWRTSSTVLKRSLLELPNRPPTLGILEPSQLQVRCTPAVGQPLVCGCAHTTCSFFCANRAAGPPSTTIESATTLINKTAADAAFGSSPYKAVVKVCMQNIPLSAFTSQAAQRVQAGLQSEHVNLSRATTSLCSSHNDDCSLPTLGSNELAGTSLGFGDEGWGPVRDSAWKLRVRWNGIHLPSQVVGNMAFVVDQGLSVAVLVVDVCVNLAAVCTTPSWAAGGSARPSQPCTPPSAATDVRNHPLTQDSATYGNLPTSAPQAHGGHPTSMRHQLSIDLLQFNVVMASVQLSMIVHQALPAEPPLTTAMPGQRQYPLLQPVPGLYSGAPLDTCCTGMPQWNAPPRPLAAAYRDALPARPDHVSAGRQRDKVDLRAVHAPQVPPDLLTLLAAKAQLDSTAARVAAACQEATSAVHAATRLAACAVAESGMPRASAAAMLTALSPSRAAGLPVTRVAPCVSRGRALAPGTAPGTHRWSAPYETRSDVSYSGAHIYDYLSGRDRSDLQRCLPLDEIPALQHARLSEVHCRSDMPMLW